MHCLGIYRQEFEKKFLTGKVIILEFAKLVSFMQKKKNFKFGTKIALFGYFWATILKNYFHIWNQHPQICQTLRFRVKIKMLKFGTKNTQFWCFEAGILNTIVVFGMSILKYSELLAYDPLFPKVHGPLFLNVRVRVWVHFLRYAMFP